MTSSQLVPIRGQDSCELGYRGPALGRVAAAASITAVRRSRWPARGTIVTVPVIGSSGEPYRTSASSPISTYRDAGSFERAQHAEHVGGCRRRRASSLRAGCPQRLGVAQGALQSLRRRERERRSDLLVAEVIGAREAEGELEPAGGAQRPRARQPPA